MCCTQVCNAEVAAADTGVTQCSKWGLAARMQAEYSQWRSALLKSMLVCGFCGRAAFGGTPYAAHRFRTVDCKPWAYPPYATAHLKLALYCGTR